MIKLLQKSWSIPILLLAVIVLSFGVLAPSLGFYWDDWPSLLIHDVQGMQGFQEFFRLDRPTTHWSYNVLMPVLGVTPLYWQIFSLGLRWVTALLLWAFVRQMWPQANDLAVISALLFAVHPIFRQQSIALTYHQLWLEFVFYMISLWGMAKAIRDPRRYWFWTICALFGLALNFLISEYFLGIEFIRPVILLLALKETSASRPVQNGSKTPGSKQNAKPAFLRFFENIRFSSFIVHWLPYLAVLLVYFAWRFIFMELPGPDRNALVLLTDLRSAPLPTLVKFLQTILQDVSYILFTNWYTTFQPGLFDLQNRFTILTWGVASITFALTLGYLSAQPKVTGHEALKQKQNVTVLLLGILIATVAALPAWVTGRQVIVGAWSDRLAVPAMMGASMALAGLIAWLVRNRTQAILIAGLLIGLAVGNNLRVANDYRWAHILLNRFYWQLSWRAPDIAPSTAIFADAEILAKTGLYSTAAGINILYAEPSPSGKLPYWFFSISREYGYRLPELIAGTPLQTSFRQFTFEGNSQNSLIVYYNPAKADCMRIVTPQDANDPDLPPLVLQTLSISNLSTILDKSDSGKQPSSQVFGEQPEPGWCHYFQKADLARQLGDWESVVKLGDQAVANGYTQDNSQSNTPQEWIPFIEGYAHAGRWQEAIQATSQALAIEPQMGARMCTTWNELIKLDTGDAAASEAHQFYGGLGCK